MALRTKDQYVASLRDGRCVFYRGQQVPDVTLHPTFRIAIDHASIDFDMAEDARWRELAVVGSSSRYFHTPQDAEDLKLRSRLIEEATREGATLVLLIKEIGSDALFALSIVAEHLRGAYPERVRAFMDHCREGDLAIAVAQTDVKGDRTLGPSDQPDADAYVRVVERRADGIVVRGTKCHTSVSVNANELIVLPTRELREQDHGYAVAFAIPVDTPGLTLIASPYLGAEGKSAFEHPISSRHKMIETTTLFNDVFVPWDRVFMCGEYQHAGLLAKTFVEFHRFTAISYKLPLVDALVGAAWVAAEMNGTQKAGHVRDKLSWLVSYATSLRALTMHAADRCQYSERPRIAIPDPLLVNIAKLAFAQNIHTALLHVQDIAGGLLVTAPSEEDLAHLEHGDRLARAFAGAAGTSGRDRLRLMNLISELTAGEFSGYQAVLAVHAEGSIEAEKLTILRAYDPRPSRDYVRRLAGIDP